MEKIEIPGPVGPVTLYATVEVKKGKDRAIIDPADLERFRANGWEKVGDVPPPSTSATPVPEVSSPVEEESVPQAPEPEDGSSASEEKELTKTDVRKMSEEELTTLVEEYSVDVDLSAYSSLTKKREAVVAALFSE